MRNVFDQKKFCDVLLQKVEEKGYSWQDFIETDTGKILLDTIWSVPLEDRYYDEDDIDYYVKINLCLIGKFKDQLIEEYGCGISNAALMLETLYQEQNAKTPEKWYNYCWGSTE